MSRLRNWNEPLFRDVFGCIFWYEGATHTWVGGSDLPSSGWMLNNNCANLKNFLLKVFSRFLCLNRWKLCWIFITRSCIFNQPIINSQKLWHFWHLLRCWRLKMKFYWHDILCVRRSTRFSFFSVSDSHGLQSNFYFMDSSKDLLSSASHPRSSLEWLTFTTWF